MNTTRLRELVARYEAAETSLAEERELRELVCDPALPRDLLSYRTLLGASAVLAKAAPSTPLSGPWDQAASAKTARVVQLKPRTARLRYLRFASLAAAAVLLVALGVGLLRQADSLAPTPPPIASAQTIDWSKYEVTDVAEAKRITAAALGTVTRNIDQSGRITSREVGRMHPIRHTIKL